MSASPLTPAFGSWESRQERLPGWWTEPILLRHLTNSPTRCLTRTASETVRDAVERAIATGPFAAPGTEQVITRALGSQLLAPAAWQLLIECVASPRAALFVSPSARLARVPWGLLAMPGDDGFRLMELADVLMAAPSNIINSARTPADWDERRDGRAAADSRSAGARASGPTPAWARYSADPRRKQRWRNIYGS